MFEKSGWESHISNLKPCLRREPGNLKSPTSTTARTGRARIPPQNQLEVYRPFEYFNGLNKLLKAFEGIIYGTLIGAGAGIAIGTGSQVVDSGGNPFNFFYSIIYSTITGAVGGLIYGYLNPGEIKIKLNENF